MKKIALVALFVLVVGTSLAVAQSSGNFSYSANPMNYVGCTVDSSGTISGGEQCEMSCDIDATTGVASCTDKTGTGCDGHAVAGIKTSSGAGNIFVIRPSAVVGLLTNVRLDSTKQGTAGAVSSSALAGVDFMVTVRGPHGDVQVLPGGWVTYDARYIQISTNLFQALATQCLANAGGCFIEFDESTVSAHSFDFLAGGPAYPLSSGKYTVTTTWRTALGGSGISKSLTCVGPLNLTVQQNKVFSFNTINDNP